MVLWQSRGGSNGAEFFNQFYLVLQFKKLGLKWAMVAYVTVPDKKRISKCVSLRVGKYED